MGFAGSSWTRVGGERADRNAHFVNQARPDASPTACAVNTILPYDRSFRRLDFFLSLAISRLSLQPYWILLAPRRSPNRWRHRPCTSISSAQIPPRNPASAQRRTRTGFSRILADCLAGEQMPQPLALQCRYRFSSELASRWPARSYGSRVASSRRICSHNRFTVVAGVPDIRRRANAVVVRGMPAFGPPRCARAQLLGLPAAKLSPRNWVNPNSGAGSSARPPLRACAVGRLKQLFSLPSAEIRRRVETTPSLLTASTASGADPNQGPRIYVLAPLCHRARRAVPAVYVCRANPLESRIPSRARLHESRWLSLWLPIERVGIHRSSPKPCT